MEEQRGRDRVIGVETRQLAADGLDSNLREDCGQPIDAVRFGRVFNSKKPDILKFVPKF
jgi:hypothetical protein